MDTGILLSFLSASVLLTLLPGPDNIFVLTESLTKGRRNGLAIALGLALGVLVHTAAAATGLSLLLQQSALAFSVIKYLGAAYLFYLAYKALTERASGLVVMAEGPAPAVSTLVLVRKGFLMNVLNPKVALFFIAFLPQFVSKTGLSVMMQMSLLGVCFMLQALVIFALVACLAGMLTKYVTNAAFWQATKWSKVTVLSGLGLVLALAKR